MTTDTVISTDKSKLDVTLIHDFLRRSYWAEDIPLAIVEKIDRKFALFRGL
jgi:hypothetical protein